MFAIPLCIEQRLKPVDAIKQSYDMLKSDWLMAGGAFANHQAIIPESEMFFEYGHGLHFSNSWVRGLEASYQQHWFWYQGAHVLTLNCTQIYYLPHGWTWTLSVTGARSGEVLMFAWMNREALARTAELGQAVYWSRSRARG